MSDESLSLEVGEYLGRLEQLRAHNHALQREVAAIERSFFIRLGKLVRRYFTR